MTRRPSIANRPHSSFPYTTVFRSALLGPCVALPKTRVTNPEWAKRIDTSDEWSVERTGIRARHIAGEGETTATLAIEASLKAIDAAGMKPGDIDQIGRAHV